MSTCDMRFRKKSPQKNYPWKNHLAEKSLRGRKKSPDGKNHPMGREKYPNRGCISPLIGWFFSPVIFVLFSYIYRCQKKTQKYVCVFKLNYLLFRTDFTDLNLYCIKGALALFVLVSFFWLRVLDKAEYSAFESTLNSPFVSYRKHLVSSSLY